MQVKQLIQTGYQEDDFFDAYESPIPYPYPPPGIRPPIRAAPYYRPFGPPGPYPGPMHRGRRFRCSAIRLDTQYTLLHQM